MGLKQSSPLPLQDPQVLPQVIKYKVPLIKKHTVDRSVSKSGNKQSTQIGFQLYLHLKEKDQNEMMAPWERYDLCFELDYPSLSRIFTDITDHLWPSDTVHLYRMATASVINPTPIALACIIKGLTSPFPHSKIESTTESDSGIIIRLPPYSNHLVDNPVFEATFNYMDMHCRFDQVALDVIWSLHESTPQQLIQWMLEEEREMICFSVFLDLIYFIKHET